MVGMVQREVSGGGDSVLVVLLGLPSESRCPGAETSETAESRTPQKQKLVEVRLESGLSQRQQINGILFGVSIAFGPLFLFIIYFISRLVFILPSPAL